jgi:Arc/MetJ family transcription regulator
MPRVRLSTTVDPDVLARVRALDPVATDASLVDRAFRALLEQHRRAEVDAAYARAYTEHPLDERDEWGDLESFGAAVRRR